MQKQAMSLLKPIALLAAATLASLLLLSAAIHSVPLLRLPTSLELITSQISHLRTYAHSSPAHALHLALVLALLFVSKQAFSVPGTALLNILLGAIYPIWIAAPLSCLLTALGSTAAYLLARTARPLFVRLIPRPLLLIQRAVDPFRLKGSPDRFNTPELASYLLIARLLPIVPYAALNLASGVLELPLLPFFWTILIGSLPYNLLTTQLGDILRSAAESTSPEDNHPPTLTEIWTLGLLVKLASLSLLAVLPVVFKEPLRNAIQRLIRPGPTPTPRKTPPSPIITRHHSLLLQDEQEFEFEDEEQSAGVQLSPSTTITSSSASSSSADDHHHHPYSSPVIHLDSHPHSKLLPSHTHIPLGLNILNTTHLLHLHPHPASIFDLPYRKAASRSPSPNSSPPFS
ncbi:hypothetical protein PTTG_06859 [Puccinia triticina 1-1 BBBD Race 1]|uniref:Golgi apparatus membrane protein TVP38 n=1 Tax=Puccinia triticina (isolate 1-1 / race 1 (BBBD)) TaxID=630390 RepID=A0A180H323_PUCT1|nr:hypothetical protein PTTG_06859 [Puccinia triticina 1-1 BBBD Race 1]